MNIILLISKIAIQYCTKRNNDIKYGQCKARLIIVRRKWKHNSTPFQIEMNCRFGLFLRCRRPREQDWCSEAMLCVNTIQYKKELILPKPHKNKLFQNAGYNNTIQYNTIQYYAKRFTAIQTISMKYQNMAIQGSKNKGFTLRYNATQYAANLVLNAVHVLGRSTHSCYVLHNLEMIEGQCIERWCFV